MILCKDRFVIVIEACNIRALAAYQKGMTDLDRIWPQVVAYATRRDEQLETERKAADLEREQKLAEAQAAIDAYQDAYEAWIKTPAFFRGAAPTKPFDQYRELMIARHCVYTPRCSYMARFESIRADLKHMADVAGAAVGPYRMTEAQVREMVDWEDGSRVERIKAEIARGDDIVQVAP